MHSGGPPSYHDVAAYYCTYCSYTVCLKCYALLGDAVCFLDDESEDNQNGNENSSASSSSSSSSEESSTSSLGNDADESLQDPMAWLDTVLAAPPHIMQSHPVGVAPASAPSSPSGHGHPSPPCHLCHNGRLVREEALLHEWYCEGPLPEARRLRGDAFVYETDNLQKYYNIRSQRQERLASLQPLVAQVHQVYPTQLDHIAASGGRCSSSATVAPPSTRHERVPASKSTSMYSHLEEAPGTSKRHHTISGRLMQARQSAEKINHSPPPSPTCEEGGSFVYSVYNPRAEVSLVWCATSYFPREEHPAYSGDHSVVPLFTWRCPPSLPGLPPRPYRLCIPYGAYAYANMQGLALYIATDIYRKAATHLVAVPSRVAGAEGSNVSLAAAKVVPSVSLQPLLTVVVLHHIAATPRPLSFAVGTPLSWQHAEVSPTEPYPASAAAVGRTMDLVDLPWPDGLSSTELSLSLDHLLHGRSVAVYGVASKYGFLSHVARSAVMQPYHVRILDASPGGRAAGPTTPTSSSPPASQSSGAHLLRALVDIGNFLSTASVDADRGGVKGSSNDEADGAAPSLPSPLKRAMMEGERQRSPALPRDTTSAILQANAAASTPSRGERQMISVVDVVDVDSSSNSIPHPNMQDPDLWTPQRSAPPSGGCLPGTPLPGRVVELSDEGARTPCLSLKSTTSTEAPQYSPHPGTARGLPSRSQRSGGSESASDDRPPGRSPCVTDSVKSAAVPQLLWKTVEDVAGPLQPPRCPSPSATRTTTTDGAATMTWRAPQMHFASASARRDILRQQQKQKVGRRCIRWASLPSTLADAHLRYQHHHAPSTSSLTTLLHAHQLRSGWAPPVLLVVHSVDCLLDDEAQALQQLVANFSFPYTRLLLLLSFDDPQWPLTPLAASLERIGLCTVQLRSMMMPRIHEMRHLSSLQLLTNFETVMAASRGGRGSGVGGGHSAHLREDTIERVLWSLPHSFLPLLRVLLSIQEAAGEGQYVSLFTIVDKFEQQGIMVSHGKMKSLQRELTSNRLALYDAAEHALMIPQLHLVKTVLDAVEAKQVAGVGARGLAAQA